jgi:hypothetical protein
VGWVRTILQLYVLRRVFKKDWHKDSPLAEDRRILTKRRRERRTWNEDGDGFVYGFTKVPTTRILSQSSVLFLLLGWHPTLCQHANDTGDVILHAAHTLIMSVLSPLSLALFLRLELR